jgi:hypothetical protein
MSDTTESMTSGLTPEEMLGHSLEDSEGRQVGLVTRIYFDNRTHRPEWLEVSGKGWLGRLGLARAYVPVEHATRHGDAVQVPYKSWRIKASPRLLAGEYISSSQEARLCYHYGSTEHGHGSWAPHTGEGWPVHRWFFGGPRYGWMAGHEQLEDARRHGDGSAFGPRASRDYHPSG